MQVTDDKAALKAAREQQAQQPRQVVASGRLWIPLLALICALLGGTIYLLRSTGESARAFGTPHIRFNAEIRVVNEIDLVVTESITLGAAKNWQPLGIDRRYPAVQSDSLLRKNFIEYTPVYGFVDGRPIEIPASQLTPDSTVFSLGYEQGSDRPPSQVAFQLRAKGAVSNALGRKELLWRVAGGWEVPVTDLVCSIRAPTGVSPVELKVRGYVLSSDADAQKDESRVKIRLFAEGDEARSELEARLWMTEPLLPSEYLWVEASWLAN